MEAPKHPLPHSYKTITEHSEAIYTEKRSKFIALAYPVECENEAMERVEAIRKKYYDARHVCWAYRIGKGAAIERANDDGEPSSTAGKPILGQIVSNDLTDTLVVVIRYFGGVKLGIGGLIVAYRTAAAEAIANNQIVEITLYTQYTISFPFDAINPVMMLLRQCQAKNISHDATAEGHVWAIEVPNEQVPQFEEEASVLYTLKFKAN